MYIFFGLWVVFSINLNLDYLLRKLRKMNIREFIFSAFRKFSRNFRQKIGPFRRARFILDFRLPEDG